VKIQRVYQIRKFIEESASSGMTSFEVGHNHSYKVNKEGNGRTNSVPFPKPPSKKHSHQVKNFKVMSAEGHMHKLLRTSK
jgi:hypothetical protein